MKRALLWSHTANLSGAPLSLAQLAERLPEHGYDPIFATPSGGPIEGILAEMGVRHVIVPRPFRVIRFISLLRREKPSIVHVNSLVNTWPVIVSRLMGKPVVWHVREVLGRKRGYARLIHGAAHRVILISKEQAALFHGLGKALYVPNAIDPAMYRGAKPADIRTRKRRETLVVAVGSVEPRKGFLTLARAAALLKDREWIRFAVVGETKEAHAQYRIEIEEFIGEHALGDRFLFLGPRADIPNVLAAADMLCHPAHVEAFGRVILEAMAAGVAVIASAVGEIPEILDHGGAGVLVPPGDEKELAAAIAKLDGDTKRRAELVKKAVHRVEKVYNLNAQAKTVAGAYDVLLKERMRGREVK